MIANSVIQADLLAAIKANAAIIAVMQAADHAKEDQYQGTQIDYPALRLWLGRQIPITNRGHCDHARLDFAVRIYTEGASSKQADDIAIVVNNLFHGDEGGGKWFGGSTWYSFFRSTGLASAFAGGEKLWRADTPFSGVIYPRI